MPIAVNASIAGLAWVARLGIGFDNGESELDDIKTPKNIKGENVLHTLREVLLINACEVS
jgi:hypothetical protein